MKLYTYAAVLCVAMFSAPAWALPPGSSLITYVDATDGPAGNTSLATGGVFNPPRLTTPIDNDNQWTNRTFGIGNTVFTSNDFSVPSENAPGLVTQVTGLVPLASYNMFAYLWVDNMPNSNWRVKASLTQMPPLGDELAVSFGALATATTTLAPPAVPGDFLIAPIFQEGNRRLLQATLGQTTADATGNIRVWIDDYSGPNAVISNRSWYDGVGYSLVPESGGIVLVTVAAFLIVAIVPRRP